MIISGSSNIGRVRSSNQDSFITGKISDSVGYAVVCDGMGGHAMGEIASEIVGKAVCGYWERSADGDSADKARKACRSASAKLNQVAFGMFHLHRS